MEEFIKYFVRPRNISFYTYIYAKGVYIIDFSITHGSKMLAIHNF